MAIRSDLRPFCRRSFPEHGRAVHALCWAFLLVAALAGGPPVCRAQGPASLGDAVMSWSRGTWAAPVFCRIDGETVRGIRRVLIRPTRNVAPGQTVLTVQFIDMQVDDAERCFDLVGNELPNLIGKLQLRFNSTSHPETFQRDFERAIKRDRGFEFDITGGVLRVQAVGPEAGASVQTSFRGGEAWLREPARASDSERALAEFDSPRKLEIEIRAPDAQRQLLPLFLLDVR